MTSISFDQSRATMKARVWIFVFTAGAMNPCLLWRDVLDLLLGFLQRIFNNFALFCSCFHRCFRGSIGKRRRAMATPLKSKLMSTLGLQSILINIWQWTWRGLMLGRLYQTMFRATIEENERNTTPNICWSPESPSSSPSLLLSFKSAASIASSYRSLIKSSRPSSIIPCSVCLDMADTFE